MSNSARSRAFCFTINNYTYEDMMSLLDIPFRYMCLGFEVGDETETPHIQGYIYFHDQKTRSAVSKIMKRASIRYADGTPQQNLKYISKSKTKESPDDWYEFGDMPFQGKAQWHKIKQAMTDPKNHPHLYQQYHKTYKQIKSMEKKEHARIIYVVPHNQVYRYAKSFESVKMDQDPETYDEEQAFFLAVYADSWVLDWVNGYPHKIKRGYEIITVDPTYVVFYYDDNKEFNYINKKYYDYIECLDDLSNERPCDVNEDYGAKTV